MDRIFICGRRTLLKKDLTIMWLVFVCQKSILVDSVFRRIWCTSITEKATRREVRKPKQNAVGIAHFYLLFICAQLTRSHLIKVSHSWKQLALTRSLSGFNLWGLKFSNFNVRSNIEDCHWKSGAASPKLWITSAITLCAQDNLRFPVL